MTTHEGWTIVAGRSVGPVTLGDSRSDVDLALGVPPRISEAEGFESRWYDSLTVTLFEGGVRMIVCERGSLVATPEGVVVGTPIADLLDRVGSLVYDDEESLWRSPSVGGLLYEVVRPAEACEDPIDPPFVPEQYDITRPEAALVRRIFVQ